LHKLQGDVHGGGVLSPTLRNLVVDKLPVEAHGLGFNTIGYADDTVITVQGKSAHTVGACMQSALNAMVIWAVTDGNELKMLREVKYLWVILDSKLS
jgi:hypothetical protein